MTLVAITTWILVIFVEFLLIGCVIRQLMKAYGDYDGLEFSVWCIMVVVYLLVHIGIFEALGW